jgi:hypothetical protein
LLITEVAKN